MAYRHAENKLALVIDDNACLRTLLRIALKCGGLRVIEAGSGEEAAVKAEQLNPDLILTDLEMPMGGFDNIRRLRTLCRTSPIVVLSALDARDVEARSLESGGDLFLEKPFHLSELRTALTRLLSTPQEAQRGPASGPFFVDSL